MSGKRNKRTSQSAISTMHLKRRFWTPSSSISIQNAELFSYLNFDETSFYLQSSFMASKCGWTSLWPKLSHVHDSYAVFSLHLLCMVGIFPFPPQLVYLLEGVSETNEELVPKNHCKQCGSAGTKY